MSYRWHSQRQGSFDAIRLTWIAGEASLKTATGRELNQSVAGKRKSVFWQSSRWPKA